MVILAAPPAYAEDQVFTPEIQKVLFLPEDKIDIADAAFAFAKAIHPETDTAAYSAKIDRLVAEVKSIMGPNPTPEQARAAMSEVIFHREGFKYDFASDAMTNVQNYYLPATLERKMGTCETLPMLYMAVAQRAGLPVYAAYAPQHNFLRITDPRAKEQNIEVTSGGGIKTDASYIRTFKISPESVKAGTYLKTKTHHEYLANLLATNGHYYYMANQLDKALAYYQAAWEFDPHLDGVAIGLTLTFMSKSSADVIDYWQSPNTSDGLDRAKQDVDQADEWSKTVRSMGVNWEDYKVGRTH